MQWEPDGRWAGRGAQKVPEGAEVIGNYLVEHIIGKGSFAEVKLGRNIKTGEQVRARLGSRIWARASGLARRGSRVWVRASGLARRGSRVRARASGRCSWPSAAFARHARGSLCLLETHGGGSAPRLHSR